ncbi:hypothetical protein GCM10023220_55770 [Streptomyces ziwulingensis]|uniref:Uncharacterized protein n=1 Tax=Streptomyces ziwulingensis TaxID=1045501 RepID=A0ABP9CWP5_9ACTN
MPETYAAGLRGVNRRRALTTHLVPEQGPMALRVGLRAVASGRVLPAISRALAEQLRKQLHGRFPLTETDPPVGQDEP